jgi:hypothetical protein
MGCDIHLFVERKHKDKWVMSHEVEGPGSARNYHRFAALAGVRFDGPAPRGMPADPSESVLYHADEWTGDAHSHGWFSLAEAIPIFVATEVTDTSEEDRAYAAKWPESYYFNILDFDPADMADWRVVFWFDN